MKKLIFAALAAVFMLSSGFTKENQIIKDVSSSEDFYDCTYTLFITELNAFGDPVRVRRTYSVNTIGPEDCKGHMQLHMRAISIGIAK